MSTYDILIVGSGIVGATTALAFAQKTKLKIALLDAKKISAEWHADHADPRVSAISLASQRIFQNLGVWSTLQAKRISPYQKMVVWDAGSHGEIQFDSRAIQEVALGYIVEDSVMRTSILEQCARCDNLAIISSVELDSLHEAVEYVELQTKSGHAYRTKLLIGADGGQSWVREQAGIEFACRDYAHSALVTTVKTELPHQMTAWQRFLATGPLAFLPLADLHTCSIVWSTSPAEATRLLALSNTEFQSELAVAFDHKLGRVVAEQQRYRFDLYRRHVKNYVKPRLVLVGDAAHTIHPMAGQGVNLGLLDAACLVDVMVDAIKNQRDLASFSVLRRYERWRKSDNATMLNFVEGVKCLFASEVKPVQQLRHVGMAVTNHLDFIKNYFSRYATGDRSDMPKLAHTISEDN